MSHHVSQVLNKKNILFVADHYATHGLNVLTYL